MKNTALIIVDIQNDFLFGGALAVKNGDDIIPIVNNLQQSFNHIIATQDWHPANHKSFANEHKNKKIGDFINLNGVEQILWPNHCIEKTFGSQFSEILDIEKVDRVIKKGNNPEIDSYSGFFENDKKTKTELDNYLKHKNIDTIYICGLATDYCVKYTALDAVELGYKTYLIEDAIKGVNIFEQDSENAISEMKNKGVIVTKSIDI